MDMKEYKKMHRRLCSEGAKKGLHERAKDLKWSGSTPLGYKLSKSGWLIVDPNEAEIVKEVFDNYIYFRSLAKTALALNVGELKTRTGNQWRPGTVRDIVFNDIYIGNFQHSRVKKHLKALRIISDDVFQKAQTIRQQNFEKYGNIRSTSHYVKSEIKVQAPRK